MFVKDNMTLKVKAVTADVAIPVAAQTTRELDSGFLDAIVGTEPAAFGRTGFGRTRLSVCDYVIAPNS